MVIVALVESNTLSWLLLHIVISQTSITRLTATPTTITTTDLEGNKFTDSAMLNSLFELEVAKTSMLNAHVYQKDDALEEIIYNLPPRLLLLGSAKGRSGLVLSNMAFAA